MAKLFSLLIFVLLVIILRLSVTTSDRILVIFSSPVLSHFFLGNVLVKELVNKGHNITYINSFGLKLNKINFRDIVIERNTFNSKDYENNLLEMNELSEFNRFNHALKVINSINGDILSNPEIQMLLKSGEQFDLVIMESFFSEALVGFAHHYNCPLIIVSSVGPNVWSNYFVKNQSPPSYIPHMFSDLPVHMNFWQRIKNFLLTYLSEFLHCRYHLPEQEARLHKYFPSAPSLEDVIKERMKIILLNSHPSIATAKPTVPSMVEIGGFHISKPKPLPNNLKNYMDEAKEGVILFSMGSTLQTSMFSNETQNLFRKIFSQLPQKVLWKFDGKEMPGQPDNVRIAKWLPQNDILAHPNIKLFITHGGMLSTTETVYHGVPILGIPVFGDQEANMAAAECLGIGKKISFKILRHDNLMAAIKELLYNKTYSEKVKLRSALFKDQLVHPLNAAMYWIEYVLRHKNTDHLMTPAIHLNWYQIHSIDVLSFLGSILLTVTFILYIITKKCFIIIVTHLFKNLEKNKKKNQ